MSVRALETLRGCDEIFAEFYTSRLIDSSAQDLEEYLGREITVLLRKEVEEGDVVIALSKNKRVAFLTAGDPMAATTHVDLRLRAEEEGIETSLIHGISIFTAAASAFGLQPYKFGRTVTVPFPEPGFHPASPYDHILENKQRGLHTLVLLDIKEEEQRYMTASQAVQWLCDSERNLRKGLMSAATLVCAAARLGSPAEKLAAGFPKTIMSLDLGPPLHSLIIPGRLHFMEARSLVTFAGAPAAIIDD